MGSGLLNGVISAGKHRLFLSTNVCLLFVVVVVVVVAVAVAVVVVVVVVV